MKRANLIHSIRQRLINLSRERKEDYNLVLIWYALERLLYRITKSQYKDAFILKGAMLFSVWVDTPYRPTKDLDLLGFGDSSNEHIRSVFDEICGTKVEPDGLDYDASSIEVADIRGEEEYQGKRVHLLARLGNAKIRLQIDIGFGDIVTPGATEISYPTLLDLPSPKVQAYPPETFVAEKLQAIVSLGMANSRMKDYYDLWIVCKTFKFDGAILVKAVKTTFDRRKTTISRGLPAGLTDDFINDEVIRTRWKAFLEKSSLPEQQVEISEIVRQLRLFVSEPLSSLAADKQFGKIWPTGGPWHRVP